MTESSELQYRPFDFRHPDRVSKDLERSLHTLHDNFARNLSTALSGYLRLLVQARVAGMRQITYGEFIEQLPSYTVLGVVGMDEAHGNVVFEMPPNLVFTMIDRLMGGEGHPLDPLRELTAVEQNITSDIFRKVLGIWGAMWSELWGKAGAINPTLEKLEMVPQMVQVVAESEVSVSIGIEIRIRKYCETLNICLPFLVVEPVIARAGYGHRARAGATSSAAASVPFVRRLKTAPLMLEALLGRTQISLSRLRQLQPGDVLLLDRGPEDTVEVWSRNQLILRGTAGIRRGSRAVAVGQMVEPPRRV